MRRESWRDIYWRIRRENLFDPERAKVCFELELQHRYWSFGAPIGCILAFIVFVYFGLAGICYAMDGNWLRLVGVVMFQTLNAISIAGYWYDFGDMKELERRLTEIDSEKARLCQR